MNLQVQKAQEIISAVTLSVIAPAIFSVMTTCKAEYLAEFCEKQISIVAMNATDNNALCRDMCCS